MNKQINRYKQQIRMILVFFMAALTLSGITAIPAYQELKFLLATLPYHSLITPWLQEVFKALASAKEHYPFLLYGYDWLAFGHIAIAVSFFGPIKDPVRNVWVIEFGLIACLLVIPMALACSVMRGIPFWWTLIDCSFGVIGFFPLWVCRNKILKLEKLLEKEKLNLIF